MKPYLFFILGLIGGTLIGLVAADGNARRAADEATSRVNRAHETFQATFDRLCHDSIPDSWSEQSKRWQMIARAMMEDGGCRYEALPPLATFAKEPLP